MDLENTTPLLNEEQSIFSTPRNLKLYQNSPYRPQNTQKDSLLTRAPKTLPDAQNNLQNRSNFYRYSSSQHNNGSPQNYDNSTEGYTNYDEDSNLWKEFLQTTK